jgi:FkbM family methyltransferase
VNWSAIDTRSLAGRALRLPGRLIPKSMMLPIRRGPAKGLRWIVGANTLGCWLGTYELEKQRALMCFVREGMTIYDVGAQAGFYTLFFSKLVGPSGHVYAFEPCPLGGRDLVQHIGVNRLENVTILQVAVSDQRGLSPFSIDRHSCMNSIATQSQLLVPSARLDDFDYRPALIKMDVEGGESKALLGARHLFQEAKPILFVALHGREQFECVTAILREFHYAKFALDGTPIRGTPETDEIYALPK